MSRIIGVKVWGPGETALAGLFLQLVLSSTVGSKFFPPKNVTVTLVHNFQPKLGQKKAGDFAAFCIETVRKKKIGEVT